MRMNGSPNSEPGFDQDSCTGITLRALAFSHLVWRFPADRLTELRLSD